MEFSQINFLDLDIAAIEPYFLRLAIAFTKTNQLFVQNELHSVQDNKQKIIDMLSANHSHTVKLYKFLTNWHAEIKDQNIINEMKTI